MKNIGPLIINIDDITLSKNEKLVIKHDLIGGVILFSHNYSSKEQLIDLINEIKSIGNPIILTGDFNLNDNDSSIKLASSAANANNSTPVAIGITGVGFGTFHTFTSSKQNTKCLVAIDNFIQNPIVSTATTTSLIKEIILSS